MTPIWRSNASCKPAMMSSKIHNATCEITMASVISSFQRSSKHLQRSRLRRIADREIRARIERYHCRATKHYRREIERLDNATVFRKQHRGGEDHEKNISQQKPSAERLAE